MLYSAVRIGFASYSEWCVAVIFRRFLGDIRSPGLFLDEFWLFLVQYPDWFLDEVGLFLDEVGLFLDWFLDETWF